MPGGPVLQYCSVTAVVQAVVQLYSYSMDRTLHVLIGSDMGPGKM
jgi:hypothetical protein